MKALIVSDTHSFTKELEMLKERHQDEVDVMFHCGDSELPKDAKELEGFQTVNGNCDYIGTFPNDIVQDVEGVRFFVTHGHLYNIKMTLQTLLYRAKEHEAQIVCFGHSHMMGVEIIDGTLFINPGSVMLPRGRIDRTYVLLHVEGNKADVTFLDWKGQLVEEHTFLLG